MTEENDSLLVSIRDQLRAISTRLDAIEGAVVPIVLGSAHNSVAAEAYRGLRDLVARSARERDAHLAHLAQMDVAVLRAGNEGLEKLVAEWMEQAGLVRATSDYDPELYEVVGEAAGGKLSILQPAYVERDTKRVVKLGRVSFVAEEMER